MDKTYHLSGRRRAFFIFLGVICTILVVLIPLGIVMFLLVIKARIRVTDEGIQVWWLKKRDIKWEEFEWITLVGPALRSGTAIYKLKGKEATGARMALAWHEKANEIEGIIELKTGLEIGGLRGPKA